MLAALTPRRMMFGFECIPAVRRRTRLYLWLGKSFSIDRNLSANPLQISCKDRRTLLFRSTNRKVFFGDDLDVPTIGLSAQSKSVFGPDGSPRIISTLPVAVRSVLPPTPRSI